MSMSNAATFDFASDPTLTIYPAAQSEGAYVKIEGERYARCVASRSYADGVWTRHTGTREIGAPLTEAELAAIHAAPRQYTCG